MASLSLHIGVNRVDPAHYGNEARLKGCHNDAHAMKYLAIATGYESSRVFLDQDATSATISQAIRDAANLLENGDSFLITYAGHGSQISSDTRDDIEDDGADETWCLFDRMLLDDELAVLWSHFMSGVRITVISDSCHSGSVTRFHDFSSDEDEELRTRNLPTENKAAALRHWNETYSTIQANTRPQQLPIKACVILISACQDHELAVDGDEHGLFTKALLSVWEQGEYNGSLEDLRSKVRSKIRDIQSPQYSIVGTQNDAFIRARAFTP